MLLHNSQEGPLQAFDAVPLCGPQYGTWRLMPHGTSNARHTARAWPHDAPASRQAIHLPLSPASRVSICKLLGTAFVRGEATPSGGDFRGPLDCMTTLAPAREGQSVSLYHTPCALSSSIAALCVSISAVMSSSVCAAQMNP